jgi:hypothetical protein
MRFFALTTRFYALFLCKTLYVVCDKRGECVMNVFFV